MTGTASACGANGSGGKFIIRDMHLSVELDLSLPAQGVAQEGILVLDGYSDLEPDGTRPCTVYSHVVISSDDTRR